MGKETQHDKRTNDDVWERKKRGKNQDLTGFVSIILQDD